MEDRHNIEDELDEFLRAEAGQHRMYPSDHTWENIRTELHGHRSWPALTIISLFIIVSLTVSTLFNYPPKAIIAQNEPITDKVAVQQPAARAAIVASHQTIEEQTDPASFTETALAAISKAGLASAALPSNVLLQQPALLMVQPDPLPVVQMATPEHSLTLASSSQAFAGHRLILQKETPITAPVAPEDNNLAAAPETNNDNVVTGNPAPATVSRAAANTDENPAADSYFKDFGFEKPIKAKHANRFSLQLYATPSSSYRQLEDEQQSVLYLNSALNTTVHHTPALGMEAGVAVLYDITKNLKFKTGLQFNIRQYYIDATQSFGVATIAIVQNNHLDSVNIFSTFANNNGSFSTKLDNKLYQVSIPVGLQWDFINGKKWGASAEASLQPTFTLNKNAYLISTDYKYYANGAPFFFRKWNFNTSVGLDLTYKTGNLKWYFGPQIRYQHLPTYNDVYPIKEYRWDYGLRIGVTMPLR